MLLGVADRRRLPRRAETTRPSCACRSTRWAASSCAPARSTEPSSAKRRHHRGEHAPERPGGVGGHGENLLSGGRRLPALYSRHRVAESRSPSSPSPSPASAPTAPPLGRPGPAPRCRRRPQVDLGDHQPVGVRQERRVDRAAADDPDATRARRAPRPRCRHRCAPSADHAGSEVRTTLLRPGQRAEPLGQRLPGAPAHHDGVRPCERAEVRQVLGQVPGMRAVAADDAVRGPGPRSTLPTVLTPPPAP